MSQQILSGLKNTHTKNKIIHQLDVTKVKSFAIVNIYGKDHFNLCNKLS